VSDRLEKLKRLILHAATPEHERRSAFDRYTRLLCQGSGSRGRLTRSIRIGPTRRRVELDEVGRLEDYVAGKSFGEAIADMYRACRDCDVQPTALDLGYHTSREAVVAITFPAAELPDGLTFQDAIRRHWPQARVNATTEQALNERTLLVYLGARSELAGGSRAP